MQEVKECPEPGKYHSYSRIFDVCAKIRIYFYLISFFCILTLFRNGTIVLFASYNQGIRTLIT